jgi:hypothetical protein
VSALTHRRKGLPRVLARVPIVLYQRVISPALPRRCRYEPTCSRYALQAIDRYGVPRGMVLAAWRLLRCNPFSHGGYDPVEAQRVFPTKPPRTPPHPSERPVRARRRGRSPSV